MAESWIVGVVLAMVVVVDSWTQVHVLVSNSPGNRLKLCLYTGPISNIQYTCSNQWASTYVTSDKNALLINAGVYPFGSSPRRE